MKDFTLRHFHSLEDALSAIIGKGTKVRSMDRIAGGDINDAFRLRLSSGDDIFMKSNKKENISFFEAEAAGLGAIAGTGAVSTPELFCTGCDEGRGGFSFLLMAFIDGRRGGARRWGTFGEELAAMHRAPTDGLVQNGEYGFYGDNYIGAGRQVNRPCHSWVSFFRDYRLEIQFRRAKRYFGAADLRKITYLLEHLDRFLVEPEQPSLIHGDLWSGNVMAGPDGKLWVIDPAAYVGHAEADIAMTELFGRFPGEFYAAYQNAGLLAPGYERRRDLYNLYHLLNHLNLFGSAYLPSVMRTLEEYAK